MSPISGQTNQAWGRLWRYRMWRVIGRVSLQGQEIYWKAASWDCTDFPQKRQLPMERRDFYLETIHFQQHSSPRALPGACQNPPATFSRQDRGSLLAVSFPGSSIHRLCPFRARREPMVVSGEFGWDDVGIWASQCTRFNAHRQKRAQL